MEGRIDKFGWDIYLALKQLKFCNIILVLCNHIAICLEALCTGFLWISYRTVLECYKAKTEQHRKYDVSIQLGIIFVLTIYLFPSQSLLFLLLTFQLLHQYTEIYYKGAQEEYIFINKELLVRLFMGSLCHNKLIK